VDLTAKKASSAARLIWPWGNYALEAVFTVDREKFWAGVVKSGQQCTKKL